VRAFAVGTLVLMIVGGTLRGQDQPGTAVLRKMHDRYAATWYHTLVFDQRTTRRTPAGQDTSEEWHEAARAPADLRIDQGHIADGNGVLMHHDSTYLIAHGTVAQRRPGGNPLLTFLFTVYLVPVDETVTALRAAGFDLSKTHQEAWEGRPTTVIGAGAGDSTTAQLWVDNERLVVVRMRGPLTPGSTKIWDMRFNKYRRIGGGWVSAECVFYTGGVRSQLEEYFNIQADIALDGDLFDPDRWSVAKHWSHQ